jgi:hypothetical protein
MTTRLRTNFLSPGSTSPDLGDFVQEQANQAVGGIYSLRPQGKYMTGARCVIKVNQRIAGFAYAVTWNIRTEQDEINVIDEWTPYEYAPKRVIVDGTLSMFHIPGKGPSVELIQSNILSFMGHRYITLRVEDQRTGAVLFKSDRVVVTGRSQNMQADQISTIQLTWKAIGWEDEQRAEFPDKFTATNADQNPPEGF